MNLKEAIRDVLGVREVPGTDEWPAFCFSPDHDNRNTPAASVNVRKGLWVCYSCGRGGSVSRLLSGVPISDPSIPDFIKDIESDLDAISAAGTDGAGRTCLPESWLRIFTCFRHHAWAERGFSDDAIEHFSLGYDYETDCLTYPLRDLDGAVLGVVRRRLDGGRPKYKYPSHINVHDLLFRYHEAESHMPLVLVEGALDAVACYDAGVFALALYGSHLSAAQSQLLRRLCPTSVVCAFDNDEAGANLTSQLQEDDLALLTPVTSIDWRSLGANTAKDVAELSVVERRNLLHEALDAA